MPWLILYRITPCAPARMWNWRQFSCLAPFFLCSAPAVPGFTWAQLERQLADLAESPAKAAMARDLVSALRKMSQFKPPEMVLREILCMSWALLDEGFQPEPPAP